MVMIMMMMGLMMMVMVMINKGIGGNYEDHYQNGSDQQVNKWSLFYARGMDPDEYTGMSNTNFFQSQSENSELI